MSHSISADQESPADRPALVEGPAEQTVSVSEELPPQRRDLFDELAQQLSEAAENQHAAYKAALENVTKTQAALEDQLAAILESLNEADRSLSVGLQPLGQFTGEPGEPQSLADHVEQAREVMARTKRKLTSVSLRLQRLARESERGALRRR